MDAVNKGFLGPTGSCLFLTSDSYLVGRRREDANERGTAPISVSFSQRIPTAVQEIDLEDGNPGVPGDIADFVEFPSDNEVYSEATEMLLRTTNYQATITHGSVFSSPDPNDISAGALYSPNDGSKPERLVPLQPSSEGMVPNFTCKQFSIDGPAFVNEHSILFLLEDFRMKIEFHPSGYEITNRCNAGISEAMRRLAMLDLKNAAGCDGVRYLKADKFRHIFDF